MKVADITARIHALDITQSFIVQAPAGSGKTTLLVQRYLSLLQQARYPEEIIALTFTRKAAAEMRARVLAAIASVANPPPSSDIYAYETYLLAKNIWHQDQQQQWHLQKNPQRLRIQTLDSFCHSLVRTSPLITKISQECAILQNQELEKNYSAAANSVLIHLEDPEYATPIKQLLLHLDNDYERLEILLIAMLKRREQWLPYLIPLKADIQARQMLEATLQNINYENAERCQNSFPATQLDELWELVEFASSKAGKTPNMLTPDSPNAKKTLQATDRWRTVAEIMLTKDFEWRKRLTKDQGFPADKLSKPYKERIQALLEQLETNDELRQNLQYIAQTPNTQYSDDQWTIISALLTILPLAVAELKLTFQKFNCADHAEISMAANHLLGTADNPSHLALQMDYQIQHLLVDEFQDTSLSQFRLIEKIVAEWQPGDGKTIFAVGDPMQSIYRFREAEVAIFLRTMQAGIGNTHLIPLILQTNFRSQKKIVDWITTNFAKILPRSSDFGYGGVPFSPSIPYIQEEGQEVKITLFNKPDDLAEANAVVKQIACLCEQHPSETIAVLVRSRSHLRTIIPKLNAAKIPFQGVELDNLANNAIIQDLYALTRALLHPGDRVAWLAILRAPWCGLTLRDLQQIGSNREAIIWDIVKDYQKLALSTDGQNRLQRIMPILAEAMQYRGRQPLRDLVETTWVNLSGPALLINGDELENAKTYFELINQNQEISAIEELQNKLKNIYAKTTSVTQVQIMTIHKAKGLEFDHVIIPGIHKTTRRDEAKLLMWMEKPKMSGGSDLLIAPIHSSDEDEDTISKYLQLVEQKKNFYETGRLLYVAMTRAKKSLQVLGANNCEKNSLLEQMRNCICDNWIINNESETMQAQVLAPQNSLLQRIICPHPTSLPPAEDGIDSPLFLNSFIETQNQTCHQTNKTMATAFSWHAQDQAIIGTVLHKELQRASNDSDGLAKWTQPYLLTLHFYWRKMLLQLGCIDIDTGIKIVEQALNKTLTDTQGRWILDKHLEAESEWAIQVKNASDEVETLVIDRTFVDATGTRWIIDYKTYRPNTSVTKQQYLQQLIKYRDAIRSVDQRPIRMAWYYLLDGAWEEFSSP